jgi:hypothetical protein
MLILASYYESVRPILFKGVPDNILISALSKFSKEIAIPVVTNDPQAPLWAIAYSCKIYTPNNLPTNRTIIGYKLHDIPTGYTISLRIL